MTLTCGTYLRRFALSVDKIDERTYANVLHRLDSYFTRVLGASHIEIMLDGLRVDEQPALKTYWATPARETALVLFDEEANYRGIRAFAYGRVHVRGAGVNRDSGAMRGRRVSRAAALQFGTRCSWPPSAPRAGTPSSLPPTNVSPGPGDRPRSRASLACGSF